MPSRWHGHKECSTDRPHPCTPTPPVQVPLQHGRVAAARDPQLCGGHANMAPTPRSRTPSSRRRGGAQGPATPLPLPGPNHARAGTGGRRERKRRTRSLHASTPQAEACESSTGRVGRASPRIRRGPLDIGPAHYPGPVVTRPDCRARPTCGPAYPRAGSTQGARRLSSCGGGSARRGPARRPLQGGNRTGKMPVHYRNHTVRRRRRAAYDEQDQREREPQPGDRQNPHPGLHRPPQTTSGDRPLRLEELVHRSSCEPQRRPPGGR